MKFWDVIIVGGGIIGLSLSIELRKRNVSVMIVERGEPGREASHAAAGMLADLGIEPSSPLKPIATASAQMYPEFVRELQDESGTNCDLRDEGTLQLSLAPGFAAATDSAERVAEREPVLAGSSAGITYLKERSVDPRAVCAAALTAAKHRGVEIICGSEVLEVLVSDGRVAGVRTASTTYAAPAVVNCAGAWSGHFGPAPLPTRPVKGQLLAVTAPVIPRHVIRSPDVYLVPRSDGRLLIGSTLEETGFDKRTEPETILKLRYAAIDLCPDLKQGRILEAWAGLRPGSPDNLPILGATSTPGYFVATGHFRDGILLAPITARLMAHVMTQEKTDYDLSPFSASRYVFN